MKKSFVTLFLTALAPFFSLHADSGEVQSSGGDKSSNFAQEGFYVTPQVGGAVVQDVNFNRVTASGSINGQALSGSVDASLSFDAGFRFDAPIGYRVNEWFSVEFAPGVIVNPMNSASFNGSVTLGSTTFAAGTSADIDGNLIQVPLIVNFILTIPTDSKWEPFIGGGVGALYSSATFNNISNSSGTRNLSQDANCWALGYSALAGLNYHFSKDISIGVVYKFTGTGNQNYGGSTLGDLLDTNGTFTQSVQADATFRF
jgi:opacity protein-like surface antigen